MNVMRTEVPIYMVTGFLESGKTTFIKEVIDEGNFNTDSGPVLVIVTEEGEEEYDKDFCEENKVVAANVSSLEELQGGMLTRLNREHHPAAVVIEYNGMWDPEELFKSRKPKSWHLVEMISLLDATTYNMYMANMRSIITRFINITDLTVINRCPDGMDKMSVRRVLRAVNPRMQIVFENLDGTTDDGRGDGELPYDLDSDLIEVAEEDYGIFYVETMDNPERYDGKRVKISGTGLKNSKMPRGKFVLARPAMTCCADDVALAGFLCVYKDAEKVRHKDWISVTAKLKFEYSDIMETDGIVFYVEKTEPAKKPEDDMVYFN